MNTDVAWQWAQAQGYTRYNDWHPIFHTLTIWSLTRAWPSLGAVSLFNLIIVAATLGDCSSVAADIGTPLAIRLLTTAWAALCPAVAFVAIGTWKDTPFAVVTLQISIVVFRLALDPVPHRRTGVWLATLLAAAGLLRHNGGAVVTPTIVAAWMLPSLRPLRRMLLRAVVGAAVAVLLVRAGASGLLHAARYPRQLPLQTVLHETAALITAGTPVSAEDSHALERILPYAEWSARYRCWNGNRLFSAKPTLVVTKRRPLLRAWWHLVLANPWALTRHWRCVTAFIWNPLPTRLRTGWNGTSTVERNPYGVEPAPISPSAADRLGRCINWTLGSHGFIRSLCWQPAIPLYVVLASIVIATWRSRSALPALVLSPALSNTLLWLVLPFLPHIRFQAPVLLMVPWAVQVAAADWHAVAVRIETKSATRTVSLARRSP